MSKDTKDFFRYRIIAAVYAVDMRPNSIESLPWITIINPGRYTVYYVTSATTDSSDAYETLISFIKRQSFFEKEQGYLSQYVKENPRKPRERNEDVVGN